MKYRATFSRDGEIKKGAVEAPETPALFNREGGMQTASPFGQETLRRWHSQCLKGFPDAPRDWSLIIEKSHIVEGHVLIAIEEPGSDMPEIVPVLDGKGKPTGQVDIRQKTGARASFMVKLKD